MNSETAVAFTRGHFNQAVFAVIHSVVDSQLQMITLTASCGTHISISSSQSLIPRPSQKQKEDQVIDVMPNAQIIKSTVLLGEIITYLASHHPGLSTVQFLIICRMQKRKGLISPNPLYFCILQAIKAEWWEDL